MISRRFVDSYKCITILSTSLDALLWKFTSHIRQLSPWAPFSERLSDFVSAFSHADFQFSSVQFSFGCFFSCTYFGGYTAPLPLSYSICLLFCCSLTCDANANVAAAAYVAHILCDCHWVRGWDLNESASEPCFSCCCCCCFSFFFLMLIEMRQRRDISKQGGERGNMGMGGRGRETGQVSTVVEVSYSFDCLPNCRVSSHKPSLCAYSSSLSPTLSHAWDITYNCV